jgi:hypothetical protein
MISLLAEGCGASKLEKSRKQIAVIGATLRNLPAFSQLFWYGQRGIFPVFL